MDWQQFFQVFGWSLLQSLTSVSLIMLFGVAICIGLSGLADTREKKWLSLILSLPNFVPVLFVVMSYLIWMEFLGLPLKGGFWAVVVVHVLINAGFAGVLMSHSLGQGLMAPVEMARVEGASRLQIWRAILGSSRSEVSTLALGFLGLCFVSFSVPLILGGDRILSFEILAYRYLSGLGHIKAALLISSLQLLVFALIAFVLKSKNLVFLKRAASVDPSLGYKPLAYGAAGVTGALIVVFFFNASAFTKDFPVIAQRLPGLIISTVSLAFSVGLVSALFYLLVGGFYLNRYLREGLRSLGVLSTVFLGLIFFALPLPIFLKLTLGISLLFFPTVFRLIGQGAADQLIEQLQVARVMGASRHQTFFKITGPQLMPSALRIAAVASFWAAGEYGFSSIVTGQISNLALLARNLLGGYRLEVATITVLVAVAVGALVAGIFWSLANVYRQKLIS